mgnify:FL=1
MTQPSPATPTGNRVSSIAAPGVVTGDAVGALFRLAKAERFALPAVNVVNSNSVNAVLEAARAVNSPVIIQFSNGGGAFFSGKSLPNDRQQGAILGSIAGARYVHAVAEAYGVPVILHTDHAARKLLPWIDALLEASRRQFEETGKRP